MKNRKAVVIGAGFAGLLSARVLSDFFESVVILDPDERVGSSEPRKSAAQGAHLHVLLQHGQKLLFALFPELQAKLEAAGCPKIDWAKDTVWETSTGQFPRYPSDVETYSMSRPYLESLVFGEVLCRSNVRLVKTHAEKILHRDGVVTGVKTPESEEDADLVVISGGATLPLHRVLNGPTKEEIEGLTRRSPVAITYYSVFFDTLRAYPGNNAFKQYYYQLSVPNDPLGAVICPVERGRSVATIVEYGPVRHPRMTLDEFRLKAHDVPGGGFAHILSSGVSLGDVAVFHKSDMFLRRLHRAREWPEQVFCIGDAFCSLNPVFGQGMTSALMQIFLLRTWLSENPSVHESRQFHARSARLLRLPYVLSKMGSDPGMGLSKQYLLSYLRRCQISPSLHRRFLRTLHLRGSFADLIDFGALLMTLKPRSESHD